MCPLDGVLLQRYTGESVPRTMVVKRCIRCGRWWFPADMFFSYKPAAEAKVNYIRQWGIASDVGGMILPIVSVAVLLMGLGVTAGLVRIRQQATISATTGLRDYAGVYVGSGQALLTFTSDQPTEAIEYRLIDSDEWLTAVVYSENGYYKATLENLTEGEKYIVRIREREYVLNTN